MPSRYPDDWGPPSFQKNACDESPEIQRQVRNGRVTDRHCKINGHGSLARRVTIVDPSKAWLADLHQNPHPVSKSHCSLYPYLAYLPMQMPIANIPLLFLANSKSLTLPAEPSRTDSHQRASPTSHQKFRVLVHLSTVDAESCNHNISLAAVVLVHASHLIIERVL